MKCYIFTACMLVLLAGCGKSQPSDRPQPTMSKALRDSLAALLEDQVGEHINMPPIPTNYSSDRYINITGADLSPAALKGKVVLVDIWDYTCVNCIRTLPYIKAWAEKYKDKGLVIIGVHSPEFDFEKDTKNLNAAVKKFDLHYPIVADNEFQIWNSLANRYWPAKYLFDKNGKLRTTHFGEGQYQEFEAFLQKILLERDSTLAMPVLSELVRSTDKPGSVCYRPTPETYVGFERNHLGNTEEPKPNTSTHFSLPEKLEDDKLYLEGDWIVAREHASPAAASAGSLVIRYQAKEVNLVIKPQKENDFSVLVTQDGHPIPKEDRGADVVERDGKTYLTVNEPRMYYIINNSKFGRFELKLTAETPSFGAYAYTFTTDCRTE